MEYRTFTIMVPPGKADSFVDAVNRPVTYSDEYTESDGPLGLGTSFAPSDPSTQPGLGERPGANSPGSHFYFHAPVRGDLVDRLRSICDDHNADVQETGDRPDLPDRGPDVLPDFNLEFVPENTG